MAALQRISKAIDGLSQRTGQAISWLVLGMVLVGAFNAVARYGGRFVGTNLSSNGWLELQWYLFSVVFLLGSADALRRNAHVRVDVLYGKLSQRGKAWIDLVGSLVFLIPFCVFAIWVSVPSVRASWAVMEGSPDPGGLPRYPLKTLIVVSFGMLALQGVSEVIKAVGRIRGEGSEPAVDGER